MLLRFSVLRLWIAWFTITLLQKFVALSLQLFY